MADQDRRGYDDDYRQRGNRDWTDRAADEMRTWVGDDEARRRRQQDEQREGQDRQRSWRDQGDGSVERYRGDSDRSYYAQGGPGGPSRRQGQSQDESHRNGPYSQDGERQYGQYPSRQYGSASDRDRGYSDSYGGSYGGGSFAREDEQRYGSNRGGWGTGQDRSWGNGQNQNRQDSEPSWGSSGSYGRSQGAGSFGGGRASGRDNYGTDRGQGGAAWSTGGGYGGATSFGSPGGGWAGDAPSGGPGMRESYSGRGPKGYQRSDDRIREDVSDRLEQDHGVDASDITVEVQHGEVTLSGTITSRDQKRRAEDCAESVSGVREVINNLRASRYDSRGPTATAAEASSSLLGLGGQPSREDEEKPVTAATGKASDGTPQGTQKAGTKPRTGSPGTPSLSA